ncbi:hypothetical protein CVS40_9244 [Lucilia cuprina]|nr:hypothetical protein CVS40_9244 [Lucilia cuprina]
MLHLMMKMMMIKITSMMNQQLHLYLCPPYQNMKKTLIQLFMQLIIVNPMFLLSNTIPNQLLILLHPYIMDHMQQLKRGLITSVLMPHIHPILHMLPTIVLQVLALITSPFPWKTFFQRLQKPYLIL